MKININKCFTQMMDASNLNYQYKYQYWGRVINIKIIRLARHTRIIVLCREGEYKAEGCLCSARGHVGNTIAAAAATAVAVVAFAAVVAIVVCSLRGRCICGLPKMFIAFALNCLCYCVSHPPPSSCCCCCCWGALALLLQQQVLVLNVLAKWVVKMSFGVSIGRC